MMSLSTSAVNVTMSFSLSPTLIIPPAPALKYALPSTRKSPLMCTSSSNVVGNVTVLDRSSRTTYNVLLSLLVRLSYSTCVKLLIVCNPPSVSCGSYRTALSKRSFIISPTISTSPVIVTPELSTVTTC